MRCDRIILPAAGFSERQAYLLYRNTQRMCGTFYLEAWVELFGKSWWGKMPCQLMVFLGKASKQEFKCKKNFKSNSFANLRWKMFILKAENDQIWQKLVGQSTKLVRQT